MVQEVSSPGFVSNKSLQVSLTSSSSLNLSGIWGAQGGISIETETRNQENSATVQEAKCLLGL